QVTEARRFQTGDERDALALRVLHLAREAGHGVFPGDLRELAGRILRERIGEAVGIVESLEGRLAAGAEAPRIDGRRRVAFNLDGPSLTRLHQDAAAGRALAAGAGVEGRNAGDFVFRLDQ